ncbi:Uncharacterised protein [Bordetella pertussis]|nr:Uncharacterised protein [Bordetella pertussis]
MKTVSSAMPCWSTASRICPMRASISTRESAKSPLPVRPSNSRCGMVGKCSCVSGT